VRGFIVSDAYLRNGLPSPAPTALYPPDVAELAEAALRSSGDEERLAIDASLPERHRAPSRIDLGYDRLLHRLTADYPVQVSAIRFQSPDPMGHYFLRFAQPGLFGDVGDEDRLRFGGVLEAHYGLVDRAIGRAIAGLGDDDIVLVVSAYGMEPLGIGKRILERAIGDPEISGSHEAAPDGFLMAYGGPVARSRQLRRASVVDVLPTILYFLGLPVGRDMDGYARADLFLSDFTRERPITFIPTYDR